MASIENRASLRETSIEESIEMTDFDRPKIDESSVQTETEIDLPNVPVDSFHLNLELAKTAFVSDVRKSLNITRNVDPSVYRGLTYDSEGNLMFNHKRIAYKKGGKLKMYSVNTLQKQNADTKEFLQLIGYVTEEETHPKTRYEDVQTRDEQTVAPEQTAVMKAKVDSFKATADWAKKEKAKAIRQLEQTTNASERQKLQESVQYFDQIEIQANRRYSEVMQNQFKRVNAIINDETRTIGERLKELFRRDGVTIGALITAIGMTISTIVLAIWPHGSPPTPTPNNDKGYVDKVKTAAKKTLIKIANFLLDLAKKALTALPGVIGSVVSFLLKKAGEAVLFLSEHLIIFFLALVLAVFEFIRPYIRKARPKVQD